MVLVPQAAPEQGGGLLVTGLVIRKASPQDLDAILALYAEPDIDDGHVLDLSDAERIYQRMQRYPNYATYVAVLEGEGSAVARAVHTAEQPIDHHQGDGRPLIAVKLVLKPLQVGADLRSAVRIVVGHGHRTIDACQVDRIEVVSTEQILCVRRHGTSLSKPSNRANEPRIHHA